MSIHNFSAAAYKQHNSARLEHLASLHLPLTNKFVLDVGSGVGDHVPFYLSKKCRVVIADARSECLREALRRYTGKNVEGRLVDLNAPNFTQDDSNKYEVVHAYGILYHLKHPDVAIAALASVCKETLVVETCVSHEPEGIEYVPEAVNENAPDLTQSLDGNGCRPSRKWVMDELRKHFPHVYMTRTQPAHAEFPTDWTVRWPSGALARAIFVASKKPLDEIFLSPEVLDMQERM